MFFFLACNDFKSIITHFRCFCLGASSCLNNAHEIREILDLYSCFFWYFVSYLPLRYINSQISHQYLAVLNLIHIYYEEKFYKPRGFKNSNGGSDMFKHMPQCRSPKLRLYLAIIIHGYLNYMKKLIIYAFKQLSHFWLCVK